MNGFSKERWKASQRACRPPKMCAKSRKRCASTAYARPLAAVTAPQAQTVPGLRLAGRAARRLAGMGTGVANLVMKRPKTHCGRGSGAASASAAQLQGWSASCLVCVLLACAAARLVLTGAIRAFLQGAFRLNPAARRAADAAAGGTPALRTAQRSPMFHDMPRGACLYGAHA